VILALPSLAMMDCWPAWLRDGIASCIRTKSNVAREGLATLAMALRAWASETSLPVRLASARTYGSRIRLTRTMLDVNCC